MKPRTIIPLVIGLAIGIFAIKMGVDMVQKAKAAQGDVVNVVVSAKPIDVASQITENLLSTKSVPRVLVPSDAFTDPKSIRGRVTAMSIVSGVPITSTMLAPPGAMVGLPSKIPPGMRAVSVSVTEESAVAGFLMPGNRVDVLAMVDREGTKTRLAVSDVEVGAVGQSMNEVDKDGKTVRVTKSVTLFMTPEDVQLLPSSRRGIRLALRGNAENPAMNGGSSFWDSLMARAKGSKERPAKLSDVPSSVQHVMEVVRGSQVERLVFVKTGRRGGYKLLEASDTPAGNKAAGPKKSPMME